MRKLAIITSFILVVSCESRIKEDFKAIYQKEVCDKYSLYAKNKDLSGHLSLYVDNATINITRYHQSKGMMK